MEKLLDSVDGPRKFVEQNFNIQKCINEYILTSYDGVHIEVKEFGTPDKPAIVFAHGWSCSLEYWTGLIFAMKDDFHIFAYNQRGACKSERINICADSIANDNMLVGKFVHKKTHYKPVVIGHSLGGNAIFGAAQYFPEEFNEIYSGVVMLGSWDTRILAHMKVLPLLPLFSDNTFIYKIILQLYRLQGLPIVNLKGGIISKILIRLYLIKRNISKSAFDFIVNELKIHDPKSVRAWGAVAGRFDFSQGTRNIKIPTTIVFGKQDKLVAPTIQEQIIKVLLNNNVSVESVMVNNCGHMINIEAYEETLNSIYDLTDRVFNSK